MNGTHRAGARVLVAGLAAAAVVAGGAAGAVPMFVLQVQARLAPVAGATSAGRFSGVLVKNTEGASAPTPAMPSNGSHWRLRWKASLPPLGSPAAVALRVAAHGGAPAVVRILSARCSTSARGTVTLTGSEAARIAGGDAVVTVRAGSARLRGAVKVQHTSG